LQTGAASWNGGAYNLSANQFNRSSIPDGPFDSLAFGLSASDEAGQILLWNRDMQATNGTCTADAINTSNGNCSAVTFATGKFRYGRLKMANVSGSELASLRMPIRLEYWNGSSGWNLNNVDTCTTIAANQIGFVFPIAKNKLSACETAALSVSGSAPSFSVKFAAPGLGNSGYTDLTLNLGNTPDSSAGAQCTAVGGVGAAT